MQYFVNKEELIRFSFGGINSASFSIFATDVKGLYNSFERDVEFIEVPGRDGDLLIDNTRKKSKGIEVICYLDMEDIRGTMGELAEAVEDWLQGEVKYKTLEFSHYHKALKAICKSNFEAEEVIENLGEFTIKFRVQPPER